MGFLAETPINTDGISALLRTHRFVGVPYSDDQIENAAADLMAQLDPDEDTEGLESRYSTINIRNFDGQAEVTELDALIAYMQMLGTLVDFSTFVPDANR